MPSVVCPLMICKESQSQVPCGFLSTLSFEISELRGFILGTNSSEA